MAKAVNCTVWKPCLFCQTIDYPVYSTEIDIRLTENSSDYKAAAFIVAVAKQFGVFFLPLLFDFQLSDHKIVYRNFAVTALCLWRCDLHCHVLAATCSALVDVQELFVIVYILPHVKASNSPFLSPV